MNIMDWINSPFSTLLKLWEMLSTSISEILNILRFQIPNPYAYVPDWLKSLLEIWNPFYEFAPTTETVSLFSLLFGGLIGTFIILTIVKWIIGIVT